ncbi:MAG: zf-HC2 domain-containing protein [Oscillospiraceae bacterium]|nr:zf-HC2 domain-containing protein [Oscillospiraceae bacterium]
MKLPCEMIRDILPLYHDGVCSDVSKALVKEHLSGCRDCTAALNALDAEIEIPKLEVDSAKLLKSIKSKWKKKTRLKGICIGLVVFLLAFTVWFQLTQNCYVPMAVADYTITNVCRLSDGTYYLEYKHPYAFASYGADICRTDDGAIHVTEYRPRLVFRQDANGGTTRSFLIDPENNIMHTDTGKEMPLTAFYLGCPDRGEALLLWDADMEVPAASKDVEERELGGWAFS